MLSRCQAALYCLATLLSHGRNGITAVTNPTWLVPSNVRGLCQLHEVAPDTDEAPAAGRARTRRKRAAGDRDSSYHRSSSAQESTADQMWAAHLEQEANMAGNQQMETRPVSTAPSSTSFSFKTAPVKVAAGSSAIRPGVAVPATKSHQQASTAQSNMQANTGSAVTAQHSQTPSSGGLWSTSTVAVNEPDGTSGHTTIPHDSSETPQPRIPATMPHTSATPNSHITEQAPGGTSSVQVVSGADQFSQQLQRRRQQLLGKNSAAQGAGPTAASEALKAATTLQQLDEIFSQLPASSWQPGYLQTAWTCFARVALQNDQCLGRSHEQKHLKGTQLDQPAPPVVSVFNMLKQQTVGAVELAAHHQASIIVSLARVAHRLPAAASLAATLLPAVSTSAALETLTPAALARLIAAVVRLKLDSPALLTAAAHTALRQRTSFDGNTTGTLLSAFVQAGFQDSPELAKVLLKEATKKYNLPGTSLRSCRDIVKACNYFNQHNIHRLASLVTRVAEILQAPTCTPPAWRWPELLGFLEALAEVDGPTMSQVQVQSHQAHVVHGTPRKMLGQDTAEPASVPYHDATAQFPQIGGTRDSQQGQQGVVFLKGPKQKQKPQAANGNAVPLQSEHGPGKLAAGGLPLLITSLVNDVGSQLPSWNMPSHAVVALVAALVRLDAQAAVTSVAQALPLLVSKMGKDDGHSKHSAAPKHVTQTKAARDSFLDSDPTEELGVPSQSATTVARIDVQDGQTQGTAAEFGDQLSTQPTAAAQVTLLLLDAYVRVASSSPNTTDVSKLTPASACLADDAHTVSIRKAWHGIMTVLRQVAHTMSDAQLHVVCSSLIKLCSLSLSPHEEHEILLLLESIVRSRCDQQGQEHAPGVLHTESASIATLVQLQQFLNMP